MQLVVTLFRELLTSPWIQNTQYVEHDGKKGIDKKRECVQMNRVLYFCFDFSLRIPVLLLDSPSQ